MIDFDSFDSEQVRSVALATRPPQTKEELDLFCRALRFPCESCKGTGMDLKPGTYGEVSCSRCHGEGQSGLYFGRVAVCPGHVAPLDVLWALWSRQYKHLLIMANRGGGKTRMIALVEHLLMHFLQFTISHMGGSEAQAYRGRDYVHQQVSIEPWAEAVATHEPGQTKLAFHNGAKIEWLPSTERQASGGHPEMAVLDEVDECDYDVRERYLKTPMGPRSTMVEASTWYKQEGTISRIRKENPRLPTLIFCLFETIQKCEHDCTVMPLEDGSIGLCPLYEMPEPQADGTLRTVELCGGKLARRSDGHILVLDAIANWQRSNFQSRRVEHLCQEPTVGSGSRAYWGYSSQVSPAGNVLAFDPFPIPNLPLEWTLDFNLNPMSSFIIQQAPPEYGEEWWILDEIYLYTASTEHVCQEFARRYGAHGTMLCPEAVETGHVGGLYVFGDWTGHARDHTNLKSSYKVVQEMLGTMPNFSQKVQPGDVAPPTNRLAATNQLLWDLRSGTGRRWLKIAPRCVNGLRELSVMPMKSGTMEKDKSDRVQRQLGLSHLGDALECWVWKRFPKGPQPKASPGVSLVGKRESGDGGWSVGKRATGAGHNPWRADREEQGKW